ncbi:MAG TPA: hypothetical protein VKS79_24770 [Gemmataceae bacterium]|nr:hypothetical protein [Gemmataceae bacterium]
MHLRDRRNLPWAIVTAVLAALAAVPCFMRAFLTPLPMTGGTTLGLWYGTAAAVLMLSVGLVFVALRARDRRLPQPGWIAAVEQLICVLLWPLRMIPAWRKQPRAFWLRFHVWFGLLSVVLVLCHSGVRAGGLLTIALWVLLGLIVLSGALGLLLQQYLPGSLAQQVPQEAPFEQLPHLYRGLAGRADELVVRLAAIAPAETKTELLGFHTGTLRPYLLGTPSGSPLATALSADETFSKLRLITGWSVVEDRAGEVEKFIGALVERKLADKALNQVRDLFALESPAKLAQACNDLFSAATPLQPAESQQLARLCRDAWLEDLARLCRSRREFAEQERLSFWLHGWLALVHVPLSAALLVLTIAHIVASLYY